MPSDIYSKPGLSLKVRYNRKDEEDRAEWTDTCIYESADDLEDYYTFSQPQGEGQQIQNQPAVKKQAVRRATLCKGVLCIVVLAGLISLCVYITDELYKLNYRYSQQLQELLVNHSQLQRSYNQLKNKTEVNNRQLQSSYEILSKNYSLLKDKVKVKDKLEGKVCPEGWMKFGCSCYFRSTETKSWFDSRTDCQGKGAHLVIIDSEEEQKFVADQNRNREVWIGLKVTGSLTDGQQIFEWKWVDGSPLTKMFWESGTPTASSGWLFATCCSEQGKWQHSYTDYKNWICEK